MPLILVLFWGLSSAFEQRPQNTVVKIGESFELSCSSASLPIEWYHTPLQTNDQKKIHKGYNLTFYLYGDIPGQRLMVPLAQEEHAGIYICSVIRNETTREAPAGVVVIDKDPVCTMTSNEVLLENDTAEMNCTLRYCGNAKPVMRWKVSSVAGWKELSPTAFSISPTSASSMLKALVNLSAHRSQFSCEISFSDINSSKTHNSLNYSYIWNSPLISVSYGPRNLTIRPSKEVLYTNERVHCSADGFPTPIIEWVNLNTSETTPGPDLRVNGSLVGGRKQRFMCRATSPSTNQTANLTIELKADEPYSNEDDDRSVYLLIGLLLPAFVVSLVVIGGLAFYIVSRKRKKRSIASMEPREMVSSTSEYENVDGRAIREDEEPVNYYNMEIPEKRSIASIDTREMVSLTSEYENDDGRAICENEEPVNYYNLEIQDSQYQKLSGYSPEQPSVYESLHIH